MQSMSIRYTILGAGEEALLFPDGWIAVARLNPYRVDWYAPDTGSVQGSPLPFERIAVTDREKAAYRDRVGGSAASAPEAAWAATVPPFLIAPLFALDDGTLLIERVPSADRPDNRYDVIDRQGRLVGRLSLPSGQRIGGVGKGAFYVITTRDDGIQHVSRHPRL
jgi:hypothetical protein